MKEITTWNNRVLRWAVALMSLLFCVILLLIFWEQAEAGNWDAALRVPVQLAGWFVIAAWICHDAPRIWLGEEGVLVRFYFRQSPYSWQGSACRQIKGDSRWLVLHLRQGTSKGKRIRVANRPETREDLLRYCGDVEGLVEA